MRRGLLITVLTLVLLTVCSYSCSKKISQDTTVKIERFLKKTVADTLEEDYQRTLEEEALLASIEDQSICPGCERRVHDDWQVCPNCHTRLHKSCHHCGKPMELPWNLCPYCGTPAPGMRREGQTLDEALRPLPAESMPGIEPEELAPTPAEEIAPATDEDEQPVTLPDS